MNAPMSIPFKIALVEAVAFTVAGASATSLTALFPSLRNRFAFAWRMWLCGSIALIIGNAALLAFLMPFLRPVTPWRTDLLGFLLLVGVALVGPPLISSAGIIAGCLYGWQLARRSRGP